MSSKKDYYGILGVDRGATADQLRAAHRRLARELHPDVNKAADAAERFAEVQQAYDVLSDAEKRKVYDSVGHARFVSGAGGGPGWPGAEGGRAGGRRGPTYTWTNVGGGSGADTPFDAEDISSIFEEFFGAQGGQEASDPVSRARARHSAHRAARGRDIEHEVLVPFLVALEGGVETLRLQRGGGSPETIEVRIPRGTADGAKLRLRSKGEPGRGDAGDLILTIRVGEHPIYKREGLDLVADLPVSIVEATLGAKVGVQTPRGVLEVGVPAGTPSGSRLRLRGKGVETEDGRRGDFHAVVKIVPPRGLPEGDQSLLRELGGRLARPSGDARAAE